MSRNKKRRRKVARQRQRQQKQRVSSVPPQMPPNDLRRSVWERFQDHPFWWAAGSVASFLAIGAAVWHVLQGPTLALVDVDVTSPLSIPISATDHSWLFNMTDAHVNCRVDKVVFTDGHWIDGGTYISGEPEQALSPEVPGIFQCRVITVPANLLRSAHVYVSVTYHMFWFWQRDSDALEITWFTGSRPPHWIAGHFPAPYM